MPSFNETCPQAGCLSVYRALATRCRRQGTLRSSALTPAHGPGRAMGTAAPEITARPGLTRNQDGGDGTTAHGAYQRPAKDNPVHSPCLTNAVPALHFPYADQEARDGSGGCAATRSRAPARARGCGALSSRPQRRNPAGRVRTEDIPKVSRGASPRPEAGGRPRSRDSRAQQGTLPAGPAPAPRRGCRRRPGLRRRSLARKPATLLLIGECSHREPLRGPISPNPLSPLSGLTFRPSLRTLRASLPFPIVLAGLLPSRGAVKGVGTGAPRLLFAASLEGAFPEGATATLGPARSQPAHLDRCAFSRIMGRSLSRGGAR